MSEIKMSDFETKTATELSTNDYIIGLENSLGNIKTELAELKVFLVSNGIVDTETEQTITAKKLMYGLEVGNSGDGGNVRLTSNYNLSPRINILGEVDLVDTLLINSVQMLKSIEGTGVSAMTNVTTPVNLNADTVTTAELADIVGNLINKLRAHGLVRS